MITMKKLLKTQLFIALFALSFQSNATDRWRGLVVEPENRCSEYDKKRDYYYSQDVEDIIVKRMGGRVYGPYSGRYFKSDRETDIEHIVSTSEAQDSGLCAESKETRAAFASDQLNLTLAAPEVNRCSIGGKCGYDASEWLPEKNKCWFAARIVEVKKKYEMSVDRSEANVLESILSKCDSTNMIFYPKDMASSSEIIMKTPSVVSNDVLGLYDDNRNGRITCSEARVHGIAPVHKDHPAYPFMRDADGDGVICE